MSDPTNEPNAWAMLSASSFTESETHNALYADLVAAFGELANVATDQQATVPTKTGGQYSYKYMSLGAIMAAIRQPLASHNLAVIQAPAVIQEGGTRSVEISTRLIHTSGEWIETRVPIAIGAGADAQAIGSAMTYARRYGVTALLGIASGDDDDGRAASESRPSDRSYAETEVADMPIEEAKGFILEKFDGNAEMASRFWNELIGPDRRGPFVRSSMGAIAKNIPTWRETQTIDVNADVAGAETPPPPADDPGGESPPDEADGAQTASQGVHDEARAERVANAHADVAGQIAATHGVDVDKIIEDVKAMGVQAVRTRLSDEMLDSRGNGDTIRARLAKHIIEHETQAAQLAAAKASTPPSDNNEDDPDGGHVVEPDDFDATDPA